MKSHLSIAPAARPATRKKAAAPAPAAARPQARVAKVATFAARPPRTAEQEIPFEDTGTFGKF